MNKAVIQWINEHNKITFKRFGMFDNTKRYMCCLCEKQVNLSESTSNQGYKLICNECAYEYFGNDTKAKREWLEVDELRSKYNDNNR